MMLSFIHKNQDKFHSETYQGIFDVVGQVSQLLVGVLLLGCYCLLVLLVLGVI
jgi:hypothetical protein